MKLSLRYNGEILKRTVYNLEVLKDEDDYETDYNEEKMFETVKKIKLEYKKKCDNLMKAKNSLIN